MLAKVLYSLFLILALSFTSHAKSVENQSGKKQKDIGKRIIQCANRFVGTPYDPNPLGEYVARNVIVHDEKVDCMYLVFRCTEIAIDSKGNQAEEIALTQRFQTKGVIKNGHVVNYQDRFDYAEDMVHSPKWGVDVSQSIGRISKIEGTRGTKYFSYVAIADINLKKFKNGDIIFFVKKKEKRVADEVIAHMGFIEVEESGIYLIHASGSKKPDTDGKVVKIPLKDYLSKTKFIGVAVKRLHD